MENDSVSVLTKQDLVEALPLATGCTWQSDFGINVIALRPTKVMLHTGSACYHKQYTAPEIHRLLGPDAVFIAAAIRPESEDLICGLHSYFKSQRPLQKVSFIAGCWASHHPCADALWKKAVTRTIVVDALMGRESESKPELISSGRSGAIALAAFDAYFNQLSMPFRLAVRNKTVGFLCFDD